MALFNTEIFSESLGMWASVVVVLPQRSRMGKPEVSGDEKFKTLYLLHGMSDDETIWLRRTSIERYAARLGLAVVMPAGHLSSYADMAHGARYYTYISKELPEMMQKMFPLSDKREDNYIAGLSMGGAGAMKIGLSNPDRFSAIGCLSAGCINNNPAAENTPRQKARREMLYGNRVLEGTEEDVYGTALNNLESGCQLPRIYHTCGSEDFILGSALKTKEFFESLEGNPYSYVYEEDHGVHSWEYWDEHIQHFLAFLNLEPQEGILN